MRRACTKPEVWDEGRSICVMSPVTIILVFMPMRVRNILIWAEVVFCASSRMTTASFRSSAHKGQRGYLDDVQVHVFLQLGGGNHVLQSIVQGLQVGVNLLLHVARQEAQLLASLHGGAGEDDFLYLLVLQGTHGQGDGGVGFARTGGADGKHHVVLAEGVHQLLLVFAARDDGLARDAEDDDVAALLRLRGVALDDVDDALPLMMSMMASSFSELYSAQCFSSLSIFSSKAHISSSSPSTLMTLPRATMRSLGYNALMSCILALFTP